MRYCCVPFCTSSQRKKQPGVSFHEIPADATLREQWLKVISRKDWQPNSTSNYSAVCSLHLLDADFREDTKRRMLKPVVGVMLTDILDVEEIELLAEASRAKLESYVSLNAKTTEELREENAQLKARCERSSFQLEAALSEHRAQITALEDACERAKQQAAQLAKTRQDGAALTGLPEPLELTVVLGLDEFGYGVVDS
ncbi:hypothetical protein HPB51_008856 [Rhipicephalus microplus]|uniref:THAP-type domain-containing protein n=1 Tax=Rhipicephalus microplus TaxID=6941 RepID=A0A9J6ES25_RHIMP|nr:hypothetical protein HPB51_008856 [Rhipicephalus microplus]